jgi:hypothetical protein
MPAKMMVTVERTARALMAANPLSADELAPVERAKAGDLTGFSIRPDDGTSSVI